MQPVVMGGASLASKASRIGDRAAVSGASTAASLQENIRKLKAQLAQVEAHVSRITPRGGGGRRASKDADGKEDDLSADDEGEQGARAPPSRGCGLPFSETRPFSGTPCRGSSGPPRRAGSSWTRSARSP